MTEILNIFTDGGARGNPGPAALGVVIKDEGNQVIKKLNKSLGKKTNNQAEYLAVLEAFEWLLVNQDLNFKKINFFIDSKLVVNQLKGLYKIKNGNLRDLVIKIKFLESKILKNVSYNFIPREKNKEADLLVNQTLDNKI